MKNTRHTRLIHLLQLILLLLCIILLTLCVRKIRFLDYTPKDSSESTDALANPQITFRRYCSVKILKCFPVRIRIGSKFSLNFSHLSSLSSVYATFDISARILVYPSADSTLFTRKSSRYVCLNPLITDFCFVTFLF